jgi:DNA-directed RNA polymerase alpha subunit
MPTSYSPSLRISLLRLTEKLWLIIVDILNPGLHLATLAEGAKLDAELVVRIGKGYVPAGRSQEEDLAIGWISVDAIYSPMEKVNFRVEQARVGSGRTTTS